jgi:hypothetical protein
MRNQEIARSNNRLKTRPEFSKGRTIFHVIPSESMYIRKNEILSWRAQQLDMPADYRFVLNNYDSNRTGAIATIIGGFEIYCRKYCHPWSPKTRDQPTQIVHLICHWRNYLENCGARRMRI